MCIYSCCNESDYDRIDIEINKFTRSASIAWDDCEYCVINGKNIALPWATTAVTSIPDDIRHDVAQSDGWRLLYSTVKFVDSSESYNDFDNAFYIILYNRLTGMLKGFCYLQNVPLNNNAYWQLNFSNNSKLTNFKGHFATPYDVESSNSSIVVSNITTNPGISGFDYGWNCFMTELSYDENSMNQKLSISGFCMNNTTIIMNGAFNCETNGTILSGQMEGSNVINGIATAAGKSASDWIKDNVGNDKPIKSKNVGSVLQSLANDGVKGLINTGLNKVFGSLLGGKQASQIQSIEMKTNGNITINGSLQTLEVGVVGPLSGIPLNRIGEPLGVWNLRTKPKHEIESASVLKAMYVQNNNVAGLYEIKSSTQYEIIKNPYLNDASITSSCSVVEYNYSAQGAPYRYDGGGKTSHVQVLDRIAFETLYKDSTIIITSLPNCYQAIANDVLPNKKTRSNEPAFSFGPSNIEAREHPIIKITICIVGNGNTYYSCKSFIPDAVYEQSNSARPYSWSLSELKKYIK